MSCSSKKEPVYDISCSIDNLEEISNRRDSLTDEDIFIFLYSFESGACKNEKKYLDYRRNLLWWILDKYPENFVKNLAEVSDIARQNVIIILSYGSEKFDVNSIINNLTSVQILSGSKNDILISLKSTPQILNKKYAGNYIMCSDMWHGMLARRNHCPEITLNSDGTGMCYAGDDLSFKWKVSDSIIKFSFKNKKDIEDFIANDSIFNIDFYTEDKLQYLKLKKDSLNWYLLIREVKDAK